MMKQEHVTGSELHLLCHKFEILLILVLLALSCCGVVAQTNSIGVADLSRLLIVVETSRSMHPRSEAVFNSIKTLLDAGFKTESTSKGVVSVWTFNDTLSTELFPFSQWSVETQLAFAARLP